MTKHLSVLLLSLIALNACTKKQTASAPKSPEPLSPLNFPFKAYQTLAHHPQNVNFSPIAFNNLANLLQTEVNEERKAKLEQLVSPLKEPAKSKDYSFDLSVWTKDKKAGSKEINEWITKHGCGSIDQPFDKIDWKTGSILLSTFCFKGVFAKPFKKEDVVQTHFQTSPNESHGVQVMLTHGYYPYFEDDSAQWINLEFQKSTVQLWLALPKNKAELPALEEKINATYLAEVEKGFKKVHTELVMPAFKLNQKTSLKDVATNFGVDLMSPKSTKRNFGEISQVAVFNASAFGINLGKDDGPGTPEKDDGPFNVTTMKFFADRPFIAVLRDQGSKEVLLLGRIYRP